MSDEREVLEEGPGQLVDRSEESPEEESADFEGHQLEPPGVIEDGSIEVSQLEE